MGSDPEGGGFGTARRVLVQISLRPKTRVYRVTLKAAERGFLSLAAAAGLEIW